MRFNFCDGVFNPYKLCIFRKFCHQFLKNPNIGIFLVDHVTIQNVNAVGRPGANAQDIQNHISNIPAQGLVDGQEKGTLHGMGIMKKWQSLALMTVKPGKIYCILYKSVEKNIVNDEGSLIFCALSLIWENARLAWVTVGLQALSGS